MNQFDIKKQVYLLHTIPVLMERIEENILKSEFGITYSHFRVLIGIGHNRVSQKCIADYWNITEAAVSRQIEYLENSGFISKIVDEKNKRKNSLTLTAKGTELMKNAVKRIDSTYEKLFQTIDKSYLESTQSTLSNMKSLLSSYDSDDSCSIET